MTQLNKVYMLTLSQNHRFLCTIRLFRLVGTTPRRFGLAPIHAHLMLNGVRNGSFAMRCRWAEIQVEEKAPRFIRRERLRPIGMESAPASQRPQLGEEPRSCD